MKDNIVIKSEAKYFVCGIIHVQIASSYLLAMWPNWFYQKKEELNMTYKKISFYALAIFGSVVFLTNCLLTKKEIGQYACPKPNIKLG
ncbi:MAG: hypothetical protein NWS46_04005 [Cyclobacteriaceae bacterium]|nr:hypothetical protein [Cyclobacteriaceae bacterium]